MSENGKMRRPIIAIQQQPTTQHPNPRRRLRSSRIGQQPSAALLLMDLTLLLLLFCGASSKGAYAMPLIGSTRQTSAAFLQLRNSQRSQRPLTQILRGWTLSSPSPSASALAAAKGGGGKGGGGGMGREELKNALVAEGVEEILAARAVEAADKAVVTWETQATDFCRPPEVAAIQRVLARVADLSITAHGGFPQAERRRVFFARAMEDYGGGGEGGEEGGKVPGELLPYFQAVNVEGNFLFDKAGHRDFLGAVLGAGIAREKVGDILIQGDRGAHVIMAPEVAEYICGSLASVRSVPVKNSPIPLAELGVRPPVKKEMQSVEASMRLDAVASAGMGMSRGKVKDMIEGGDVLVNWKEVTSANAQLKEGDIVTVRGKGRLEINAVEKTSKDKFRVKMTKFA